MLGSKSEVMRVNETIPRMMTRQTPTRIVYGLLTLNFSIIMYSQSMDYGYGSRTGAWTGAAGSATEAANTTRVEVVVIFIYRNRYYMFITTAGIRTIDSCTTLRYASWSF